MVVLDDCLLQLFSSQERGKYLGFFVFLVRNFLIIMMGLDTFGRTEVADAMDDF